MICLHTVRKFLKECLSYGLRNWYFFVSQFLFLCLSFTANSFSALPLNILGAVLALLAACGLLTAVDADIPAFIRSSSLICKLLALLSSGTACYYGAIIFYRHYAPSGLLASVSKHLSLTPSRLLTACGVLGAVGGVFAVFCGLLFLFGYLEKTLRERNPFSGLVKAERCLYPALFLAFCVFSAIAFSKSDCFYSSGYNKIYSLDCGIIMSRDPQGSAYMYLTHPQTYLGQPLFAVFTAPFACIPYLLSLLFPNTAYAAPLFMNVVQIFLLFTADLMLARLLKLSPLQRIFFMVLCCGMYDTLLFSVGMEQYISSLFWAVLFLYVSEGYPPPDRISLIGAAGCTITSSLLLPIITARFAGQDLKKWILSMVKYGLLFLLVVVALGRGELFLHTSSVGNLAAETNLDLPLGYRFWQYTSLIASCFFAPAAAVTYMEDLGWTAWWMLPTTAVNLCGIVILILCIVSFLLHRKDYLSQAAIGWICVSFIIICLFGYGSRENTPVLYTLYFGWAYLVLLIRLLEWVLQRLHRPKLFPVPCAALTAAMLAWNIPRMAELLQFAFSYYPAP